MRWRPLAKVPVSLTVERRFRNDRKDAAAAYLAGGYGLDLPRKFHLEAFGQAGMISGKTGGPFFDFAVRSDRKIAGKATNPVRAGIGMWGGGQTGIFRIDTGPTLSNDIIISKARVHVSADWRFRIAGDAAPASGPAITLSTSF